jgi:clan AA aspartic protease
MGEIRSKVELENERDRGAFESGHLEEHKIRSVEIEGVVDTGARTLALPQDVADQLGLPVQREITVGYADDRRETRPVVGPINITVEGRTTVMDAIALPEGSEPLIGQIILERLDLVADCAGEHLTVSPDSPDLPFLPLR